VTVEIVLLQQPVFQQTVQCKSPERKATHKMATTVISGLDGIGQVSFSIEIFEIENESICQTKVGIYCAPLMAAFESDGIQPLHFMTETSCRTYMAYKVMLMKWYTTTTFLTQPFVPHFHNHPLAT
jgi:hypothetical protein